MYYSGCGADAEGGGKKEEDAVFLFLAADNLGTGQTSSKATSRKPIFPLFQD